MAWLNSAILLPIFVVSVAGLYENNVTLTCGDGNMTISLEKQKFLYLNASQLHLLGSWCRATESATYLFLHTDLNDCSTTYMETESSLVYSNEVQTDIGQIQSVVTRDHEFNLRFNCSYPRKKFLSLSFTPIGIVLPPPQVGFGNLAFKLDFYKSDSYATPYYDSDYPLNVNLNEFVYVGYSVESSDDLVVMALNFKATRDGSFYSTPSYDLIRNGCPQDTTMEYSYNSSGNFQQFKFKAFRFFNNYDTVYFHCELLACRKGARGSRCTQGCLNSKKRRKREVMTREESEDFQPSTTKSYQIKRGPIILTEKKETLKDTGTTGKQAAIIGGATAGGGVGLLLIIGLAFLFVKYRIARLLLNRNKVVDMYATADEHMSGTGSAYVQEDGTNENYEPL